MFQMKKCSFFSFYQSSYKYCDKLINGKVKKVSLISLLETLITVH